MRSLLLPALLLAAGEAATRAAGHPFFPPPSRVAATAAGLWTGPMLGGDILPSLARVLGGFAIAALLGVAAGTALGRSRTGLAYLGPACAFARAVPPPVLIPVVLVLLHIGPVAQVAVIVSGAVWPVLLNTADGVRAVEPVREEAVRAMRTPAAYRLMLVILPGAAPKIFAGLRLALSIALILMVVSEMTGAVDGIGYQLIFAQRQFDFPAMWSGIALLGLLGWGLNTALLAVERRVLRRRPRC
ncbi:ABC transporter permease [Catenuloplanes atrovinosus]|uniref:ABC-type nitrate/sulfonate/bicarbonate transport system permease component n=1 Tax=Catenuloplanes atrovinosus TaxID=137266 RepID=A0AAE4CA14_9ACTN|nr:ABC transporter permease subunit [Catenuloplanes atrovinosus]MDR7275369.1 ABC-type nitrate/sulfonate/bicarbonate transport system permease component [Catenuloplanes atrovinosus]